MKHKIAQAPVEITKAAKEANPEANDAELEELIKIQSTRLEQRGSLIKQWNLADLEADLTWCGRTGSPTKVHRIQSVVLAGKDSKVIEPTADGISAMVHELIEDNIIA